RRSIEMKHSLLFLAMFSLAACSVGPDFKRPDAQLPATWQTSPHSGAAPGSPADSQWWQQLGDPQLTSLVERAAKANLDVRGASNRLEQSRVMRQVTGSEQLPGISANGSYSRARNSAVGLNDPSGQEGQAPFEL